jgi:hypothetical protein
MATRSYPARTMHVSPQPPPPLLFPALLLMLLPCYRCPLAAAARPPLFMSASLSIIPSQQDLPILESLMTKMMQWIWGMSLQPMAVYMHRYSALPRLLRNSALHFTLIQLAAAQRRRCKYVARSFHRLWKHAFLFLTRLFL